MTTPDRARLRLLARLATEGQYDHWYRLGTALDHLPTHDEAFVCECSPDVALALLDALYLAEGNATRQRERAEQYERDWYDAKSEFGTATATMRGRVREVEAERDTLKARLARAEEALRMIHPALCGLRDRAEEGGDVQTENFFCGFIDAAVRGLGLRQYEANTATLVADLARLRAVEEAARELVRANDESLGAFRPRPDIAWRNLKAALAAVEARSTQARVCSEDSNE